MLSLPVVQYTYIVHTSIYSTLPQIKQNAGVIASQGTPATRDIPHGQPRVAGTLARAVGNASNSRGIRNRRETNNSRQKSQKSNSSKNKSGTGVFATKGRLQQSQIRNKQQKQQQDASNSRSVSNKMNARNITDKQQEQGC